MAPCPCPLLQMFWICSPCTISLTFVLFFGTAKFGANRPGVEDSDDDVPIFAGRASSTPPTVKKACDEPRGEPRRKRRHRPRIATRKIDKVISRVLAGAEAVELIRPDEDACDLDRNVAELINVCFSDDGGHRRFSPAYYADIFHELGVTDVIRLNEPRYDGGAFASRGIAHHDLRFDDCTANQRSTCLNLTPA